MSKKALYWGLLFVLIVSVVGIGLVLLTSPTSVYAELSQVSDFSEKKAMGGCSSLEAAYVPHTKHQFSEYKYSLVVKDYKPESPPVSAIFSFKAYSAREGILVSEINIPYVCSPHLCQLEIWSGAAAAGFDENFYPMYPISKEKAAQYISFPNIGAAFKYLSSESKQKIQKDYTDVPFYWGGSLLEMWKIESCRKEE